MFFTHSRPECILFTISEKPQSTQIAGYHIASKFLVCHQKYIRKCPQNNNSDIVNPSRTRVGAELPFFFFSFHDVCEKYKWISFNEHSSAKAVCARCTELSSFARLKLNKQCIHHPRKQKKNTVKISQESMKEILRIHNRYVEVAGPFLSYQADHLG